MPQSPYIDRLRLAIDQASDPSIRGARRAELAGCLARHGDFESAEAEISSLRTEFGDGRSGRVSITIMCAEAQLIYYKSLGEQARDRMMRAQLLSVAGRDATLSALTSAWLAHINFNLHRHAEMVRSAKTCLDTIAGVDHEAASRLALTLGDAFYAAERFDVGNRWYAKAHGHAVKLGDHAMIAALTYNRAAMGTFMARVRAVDSPIDSEAIARLSGEVRTAVNYQAIAQLTSLQVLLDYALASVHILAGKHSDALGPLAEMVEKCQGTSPIERSLAVQCDLALCLAKVGRYDEAKVCVAAVALDRLSECTADDQVVAMSALMGAAQSCGLSTVYSEVASRLPAARQEHSANVIALRGVLVGFAEADALERL